MNKITNTMDYKLFKKNMDLAKIHCFLDKHVPYYRLTSMPQGGYGMIPVPELLCECGLPLGNTTHGFNYNVSGGLLKINKTLYYSMLYAHRCWNLSRPNSNDISDYHYFSTSRVKRNDILKLKIDIIKQ